jgi:hypothetical protein
VDLKAYLAGDGLYQKLTACTGRQPYIAFTEMDYQVIIPHSFIFKLVAFQRRFWSTAFYIYLFY